MRRDKPGIPPEVLSELLQEVRRLRQQNDRLEVRLKALEKGKGNPPVDYLGGDSERTGGNRPSLISPAMEATLEAVGQLRREEKQVDADAVAVVTGRSKTRESQYLSFLARIGTLAQERRGHRILYRMP